MGTELGGKHPYNFYTGVGGEKTISEEKNSEMSCEEILTIEVSFICYIRFIFCLNQSRDHYEN